jgi:hypothetical protein
MLDAGLRFWLREQDYFILVSFSEVDFESDNLP